MSVIITHFPVFTVYVQLWFDRIATISVAEAYTTTNYEHLIHNPHCYCLIYFLFILHRFSLVIQYMDVCFIFWSHHLFETYVQILFDELSDLQEASLRFSLISGIGWFSPQVVYLMRFLREKRVVGVLPLSNSFPVEKTNGKTVSRSEGNFDCLMYSLSTRGVENSSRAVSVTVGV